MKPAQSQITYLAPEGKGWRVSSREGDSRLFSTLDEVAAALSSGARVHLSLPAHCCFLERMRLPSTDAGELEGMAELQLEKMLSFPVHEVSSGILVIEQAVNVSTLMCVAVRLTTLEELCAPLRARGVILEKITPFVARVAAACPPDEIVLCIYAEREHAVLVIADRARLAWSHLLPLGDANSVTDHLLQALLIAEVEGAATDFSKVMLAGDCESWEGALLSYFPVPIEPLSLAEPLPVTAIDLVPRAWRTIAARLHRGARQMRLIRAAGAVYMAAIIAAFGYIGWLKSRVNKLDAEFAVIRPRVEVLQASQTRWRALEPAVDPDRATVELLYQLCKNLPKDTLHLTEFDESVGQWKVLGEATSASLAIDYLGKLKDEKDLAAFRISASPPALLPNEQAQFSIFGKR